MQTRSTSIPTSSSKPIAMSTITRCLLLAFLMAVLTQGAHSRTSPSDVTADGQTISRVQRQRDRPNGIRVRRRRVCMQIHHLLHGEVSCNDRGCELKCDPGYVFGNTNAKDQTLSLHCDLYTGTMLVEGRKWTAESTLCTRVLCSRPCQNGGTCAAPNKCACPSGYTGHTCADHVTMGDQPYKNYYPGPLAPNQHRVECESGSRMLDGSTSVTLSFRDNSWFFPDGSMMVGVHQIRCRKGPSGSSAAGPSALLRRPSSTRYEHLTRPHTLTVPTTPCGAPCLNGGVCEPSGTCTCRPGYAGHKCDRKVCRQPRFENDIYATQVGNLQRKVFWCHRGYVSPSGDGGVTAVCVGGHWQLGDGKVLTEEAVKCIRQ